MARFNQIAENDGLVTLQATCFMCKTDHQFTVPKDPLIQWTNGGVNISVAFPMLCASEREKLITGMCDSCQSSFFEAAMEDAS